MKRLAPLALVAVLTLVVPATARAQAPYKIKTLIKSGDMAGDTLIPANRVHWTVGLSDRGHLIFDPWVQDGSAGELLIQHFEGKFTTIARPGGPRPDGVWPSKWGTNVTAMSHRGTVLFNAADFATGRWLGIHRYDPDTENVSVVVKKGMPASEGLTVSEQAIGAWVNNLDEMALACQVKGSDGVARNGVFFVGRDGKWQPVIVGEQEIEGWGVARDEPLRLCFVSDAGRVTFIARREGERNVSAFVWEQGKVSPLLAVGTDVPGVGKITAVGAIGQNNVNRDFLVAVEVDGRLSQQGIYRLSEGKLTPLVVPGQEMPGGGLFRTLRYTGDFSGTNSGPKLAGGIGPTNQKGQTAFLASLEDGTHAVYRLEVDGKLSLVLKPGQVLEQGTVTRLGQASSLSGASPPPMMNSNGDIAVLLRLDNSPNAIAVLTPTSP